MAFKCVLPSHTNSTKLWAPFRVIQKDIYKVFEDLSVDQATKLHGAFAVLSRPRPVLSTKLTFPHFFLVPKSEAVTVSFHELSTHKGLFRFVRDLPVQENET